MKSPRNIRYIKIEMRDNVFRITINVNGDEFHRQEKFDHDDFISKFDYMIDEMSRKLKQFIQEKDTWDYYEDETEL